MQTILIKSDTNRLSVEMICYLQIMYFSDLTKESRG